MALLSGGNDVLRIKRHLGRRVVSEVVSGCRYSNVSVIGRKYIGNVSSYDMSKSKLIQTSILHTRYVLLVYEVFAITTIHTTQ